MKFIILPLLAAVTFLTSCGSSVSSLSAHEKFKARKDYVKTYDTFKASNLSSTKRSATSIVINKSTQRIQLLDNEKVVLDAPCTTGKAGKRTPSGNFRITEKIVDKRSTIFGSCYKNGVKVCGGDRRKCRRSYNKYVGASLPYWQRLTGDGIGMAFRKSDDELRGKFDVAITSMKEDGTLNTAIKKWFGDDTTTY